MWKYMMHDNGLGLVRCDWDKGIFQSYHGNGEWADDDHGFELWTGMSSAYIHYTKIDESQAAEVMNKIERYIRSKVPTIEKAKPIYLKPGEKPPKGV